MRIGRLVSALGVAAGAWMAAGPAGASGDYGCSVGWTLDRAGLDCANSIVMSPGNDTRVNLALLLRDRAGLAGKPGEYPVQEWDQGFGRTFFDWHIFTQASYPESQWEDNDYYGSRCVSLKGGDAAFAGAVAANGKLSAADREALLAARAQLAPICSSFGADYWVRQRDSTSAPAPAWPVGISSKPGKEFVSYLVASAAFYGEDWAAARSGFAALAQASDPWVKETARYMQGRVELNAAQAVAFDEWGSFSGAESTDKPATQSAGKALADYLKAYPKGAYAASAKGLQRRVLWLGGDLGGLSDAYEALLAATVPGSALEEALIEEIDNKLLLAKGAETAIDTPLLLATYDLMRMRGSAEEDTEEFYAYGPKPIDEAELAAQEPLFKGREDLYQFLRATYSFYIAGDAQDVLLRIPDATATTAHSALDFSRQVLRGQALAASNDPGEEAFWRRLITGSAGLYQRPAAELGLALHWDRAGQAGKVFAAQSPVQDSMIRKLLIERSVGPDILRGAADNAQRPVEERQLALFTLLYKQLSRGFYAGFLKDLPLVPSGANADAGLWSLSTAETVPVGLFAAGRFSDGYACPALSQTAAALAKNAKDVKGRLCLGEFYRLNGFDDFYLGADTSEAGGLGSGKELFPGTPIPRGSFYSSIIADPAAARADKAYALYRAVRCYAPAGINSCGDAEVPIEQRKAWFNTLKRQYADTKWAKGLEYYW
ncbi:hypothetical protein [Erythrobacter sp. SG61-1L]|uniref:hypothetical protein n=1 Tax=Erythrobacter sp. SG61-1L TaxID=1603897 RepID=UPI0006C906B9|nr:hypothetical protein [Erythrobacter sp. SG61-1L]